jgi:hypothetical protein
MASTTAVESSLKRSASPELEASTPLKRPRLPESNDPFDDGGGLPLADTTTGQHFAFDLGDEDELSYGPPTDGLEYLRLVR